MATGKESTDIAADVIVWIIIIVVIVFIFLFAVSLMIRYRGKKLLKTTKMIPSEGLDLSEKELGKIYELASETWDRRFEHRPIPDPQHLTQGWIKDDDGKPFYIRNSISTSISQIEAAATAINPQYARKPSQTMQTYLKYLRNIKGSQIQKRDSDKYLQFYHSARYGNPNLVFDAASYALFQQALTTLVSQIQSLPD